MATIPDPKGPVINIFGKEGRLNVDPRTKKQECFESTHAVSTVSMISITININQLTYETCLF